MREPLGKYRYYPPIFVFLCPMKICTVILSAYFLCLSFLPCADGEAFTVWNGQPNTELETNRTQSHDHEDDCGDHCSPLCFCSCCHITLRPPVSINYDLIPLTESIFQNKTFLASFTNLLLTHEIWQPPRSGQFFA